MDALFDLLTKAADAIAHALSVIPAQAWAMLLGLLASALITQRAKFWIPLCWDARLRAFVCQAIAFWTAVIVVWLLWPTRAGLIGAGVIGIASPTLYAIAVRLIGKRWPDVRDLLSQDVRDAAAAEPVSTQRGEG